MFYFFRDFPFAWLLQLIAMVLLNIVGFKGLQIPFELFGFSFSLVQQGFAVFALLPEDHDGLVRAGEKDGKFYVDLREAIARRLVQLGLKRENILVSKECTVCSHEKYWSHRYTQGNRGSQAVLIVLGD